jgi:thiol:disulfide interchange protein DsbC
MLKNLASAIVFVFLLGAAAAHAEEDYAAVRAAVAELAPNAEISEIRPAVVPGLVEVALGGQVVFISEDGRYLFQGTLFDIERRIDVTEERQAARRQSVISSLDQSEMVSFTAEDSKHELFVFTDIDCGYCRRMHQDMEGYLANGISIHYLGFPRAGINSTSHDKLNAVWCSDDRQDALTRAKAGETLPPQSCETPIAEQYQLGQQLGVTGTPALITADGYLLPGYLPPDALLTRLQNLAAN